jgi:hypothetical protein
MFSKPIGGTNCTKKEKVLSLVGWRRVVRRGVEHKAADAVGRAAGAERREEAAAAAGTGHVAVGPRKAAQELQRNVLAVASLVVFVFRCLKFIHFDYIFFLNFKFLVTGQWEEAHGRCLKTTPSHAFFKNMVVQSSLA